MLAIFLFDKKYGHSAARLSWTCPGKGGSISSLNLQEATMGDKSPKAKDKSRKQDTEDKKRRELAAKARMPTSPVSSGKGNR
jgi:hypothetical protein